MQTSAEPLSEPTDRTSRSPQQAVVRRGGSTALRWMLAAAGYALLVGAWVFASPIGAAPDEPAQAVRAAAAGQGQWQGTPASPYQPGPGMPVARADPLNQLSQRF